MATNDICIAPSWGSPNKGGQNQKWIHNPCLLRVPMPGKDRYGYVTPCHRGVPIVGKDQHGYINPAFSWVPNMGTKSEVAAKIMPSWRPGKMPPQKTEHFE